MSPLRASFRVPWTSGARNLLLLSLLITFVVGLIHAQAIVDITIPAGGHTLAGKVYAGGVGTDRPVLLLLHGFPGNDRDVLGLGKVLSDSGYTVVVFNYSGTHQSEGVFNVRTVPQDIEAAYTFMRSSESVQRFRIDPARIVLGGYSYGGGMALAYAATHADVPAVISIAGANHAELMRIYRRDPVAAARMDSLFDRLKRPTGPISFEGKEALRRVEDLPPAYDLEKAVPDLVRRHILLIGGTDDANVVIEQHIIPVYRLLKKLQAVDTRFITFQTDHQFRNVRQELAAALIMWLREPGLLQVPAKPQ